MAYTQSDLDNLDAAIAASELEVEVDGQRTRYRSIAELKAARSHVAAVLSAAQQPTGRSSFRFDFTSQREC
jgi:hypothetical protein